MGSSVAVEEGQLRISLEPTKDHPGSNQVPSAGLTQYVELTEPTLVAGGDGLVELGVASRDSFAHDFPSRRSSAARIPIPPTIDANKGANMGGPISML